jgi:hypothetical protein
VPGPVKTPSLTIGGIVVKGGEYGPFSWVQSLGLEAPRVAWALPVDDATRLLAGPREVSIQLTAPDGTQKTIARVYVVGEDRSPDALVRTVILTDVRFYLPFGWVRASYNVTVPSGTGRQPALDQVPVTTLPIVANVLYQPTSLKGSDDGTTGRPYTAAEIALDVLGKACTGHSFPPISFRNLSSPRPNNFVPNDVFVDASGETAVAQVLGALGGLDVRVADDGALELVDAFLGAEKKTVDPIVAAYSLERQGVLRWISMSNVAPTAGKVLLTRRCEVRADSLEVAPASRYTGICDNTIWGRTNDPVLINVARVTDLSLVVPGSVPGLGQQDGSAFVQGTYLPMDYLIDSIAFLNDQPALAPPLSRQNILAGAGGPVSSSGILSGRLWFQYITDAALFAGAGPNVNWSARLREIENSFRRVYKLNPVFARLCRRGSIKAERAALLDPATQTRQPATAFLDYVERPKNRGVAANDHFGYNTNAVPPTSPNQQDYTPAGGIKNYADPGPYNTRPFPLTAAFAAPFEVTVTDPLTGVFRLSEARQDTSRLHHAQELLPGLVWLPPDIELLQGNASIAFWEQARQLLTHRLAIVFSAVPAGQDNARALHAYDVSVADALARLGAPSNAVQPRAPVRELRVREGVTEARIAWDDNLREQILGCFAQTGTLDPSKLVPVNDLQLKDFAVAVFANYLAAVLDHYEGSMTVGFQPGVMPSGSLLQVAHELTADGRIYTTLRCRGVVPVAPPENMMLQSSRNILFGGLG